MCNAGRRRLEEARIASQQPPALDAQRLLSDLDRIEPDGSTVRHADLSGLGVDGFNEIVVDGRGNIYVNGGCDFAPGEGEAPGVALTTPDGSVRKAADGIASPTGWPSRPTTRR
jgi:sugar lactone lactonase YvrE